MEIPISFGDIFQIQARDEEFRRKKKIRRFRLVFIEILLRDGLF